MKSNICFENMGADHVKPVAQIEKQCFSKPWSENAIAAELSNDSANFYVAKLDGVVVGYIGMHCAADGCYIANLGVAENYRNMGVGKSLIDYLLNVAKGLEMSFVSLEVRASNSVAIGLYESFGFEHVGVRKNFYSSPKEDGLIMTLYF